MSGGITTYRPGTQAIYTLGVDNFLAGFIPAGDARLYDAQVRLDALLAIPAVAAGKLKFLVLPGPNEDASLFNWINPQVGKGRRSTTGLTFTAEQGFKGDGANGLISFGVSESMLGIGQNDAFLGVYVRTPGATASPSAVDASMGANSFILSRSGSDLARFRLNSSATVDVPAINGAPLKGFYLCRRNAADTLICRRPGGDWTNYANAQTQSDGELSLLGSSANLTLRSAAQVPVLIAGTYMSASEWLPIEFWITDWLNAYGGL